MSAWTGPTQREPPRTPPWPLATRYTTCQPHVRYIIQVCYTLKCHEAAFSAPTGGSDVADSGTTGSRAASDAGARTEAGGALRDAHNGTCGHKHDCEQAHRHTYLHMSSRAQGRSTHLYASSKAANRHPLVGGGGGQRPRHKLRLPVAPTTWERPAAQSKRRASAAASTCLCSAPTGGSDVADSGLSGSRAASDAGARTEAGGALRDAHNGTCGHKNDVRGVCAGAQAHIFTCEFEGAGAEHTPVRLFQSCKPPPPGGGWWGAAAPTQIATACRSHDMGAAGSAERAHQACAAGVSVTPSGRL